MKQKLIILSLAAICLASAALGTLAYFTSNARAHNVITTGKVDIKVTEQTIKDGVLRDYPEESISGVMPKQSVSKIVKVQNVGLADAWVRLTAEINVTSADGESLSDKYITIKPNSSWKPSGKSGDNHWYYTKPLEKDSFTDDFIDCVYFSGDMGNEYANCTVNVDINAQGVQKANNGTDVFQAEGWSKEE